MKSGLYLLLFGSCFFIISCSTIAKQKSPKPNILFFLIDDQRDDVLGCAGHPFIQTPTVDKLAENGIRFTNAFVTTSICAASRASILTGLYEFTHNFTFGKPALKKEFIKSSYPYLLKKAGYKTGFVGKLGVKLEQQDSSLIKMFDYCKLPPRSTPHFVEMSDGTKRHSAEIKGDQAIEFIRQQTTAQPFCLSVSFNAVHAVDGNKIPGNEGHYPYPQSVSTLYEDIEMPQPALADAQIFDNHPEFLKNSMNRERYFWRWDTQEKYDINLRAYFRMISGYDQVIGRIIDTLQQAGLWENTVIIYSADNGYYMGNRGFAGKWSHYEESLRVPLIICDPRRSDSGNTADQIALNIDIPATILNYAGIALPENYEGLSLLPIIENQDPTSWRGWFYCEHRMNNAKIPKYVGIHSNRYVYANYYEQDPPFEFFHDLQEDPDQLKNDIGNSKYSELISEFRNKANGIK